MDIMGKILEVVVPGFLIVFIALVILIAMVWLMGSIVGSKTGKKKDKAPKAAPAAAPVKATAPAPAPSTPPPAGGIPEETVAAISAAVACVMAESSPGVPYSIRNISRARESRPIWGLAGMQQNTKPF